MAEITTFIEQELLNNPYYRVLINTPAGVVKGFVMTEFQFSAQAEYSSPFENMGQSETLNMAATAVSMATGKGQFMLKSLRTTVATWTGTQKPTFTLPLLMISLNGEDVKQEVAKLLKGVFPTGVDKLTAPYGYAVDAEGNVKSGTISVQIGQWFYARNQILRSVDVQFSKEVLNNGLPLYASVTITFEPYRLPNADEILRYFKVS